MVNADTKQILRVRGRVVVGVRRTVVGSDVIVALLTKRGKASVPAVSKRFPRTDSQAISDWVLSFGKDVTEAGPAR